jgi:DNA-binding transcriptional LysR family regulator
MGGKAMPGLPPLIALRAFEAVGRTGSVRRAGDELGITHSVISRHVRNLEERLRARLLMRLGRGVALTREGAHFHAEIARAFEIIAQATVGLAEQDSAPLEIWCVPGLANKRLLPRLPELNALLPGRGITLRPTLARPNLERGEADAEIIYLLEEPLRSGRCRRDLARPRVFPVASPAFCARFGLTLALDDLGNLPLLHEDSTSQWREWLSAAGRALPEHHNGTRLWHAHLTIEAARLGQGVALTNDVLSADEVRSGELVEVGSSNVELGSYYLVSLMNRQDDPAMRALTRWVEGILSTGSPTAPIGSN